MKEAPQAISFGMGGETKLAYMRKYEGMLERYKSFTKLDADDLKKMAEFQERAGKISWEMNFGITDLYGYKYSAMDKFNKLQKEFHAFMIAKQRPAAIERFKTAAELKTEMTLVRSQAAKTMQESRALTMQARIAADEAAAISNKSIALTAKVEIPILILQSKRRLTNMGKKAVFLPSQARALAGTIDHGKAEYQSMTQVQLDMGEDADSASSLQSQNYFPVQDHWVHTYYQQNNFNENYNMNVERECALTNNPAQGINLDDLKLQNQKLDFTFGVNSIDNSNLDYFSIIVIGPDDGKSGSHLIKPEQGQRVYYRTTKSMNGPGIFGSHDLTLSPDSPKGNYLLKICAKSGNQIKTAYEIFKVE